MDSRLQAAVLAATGAREVSRLERVQSLWSGYGEIVRLELTGAPMATTILKFVEFPTESHHPYGWHNDFSHRRKVHSYEVEMHFYEQWASRCGEMCRVPRCLDVRTLGEEHMLLLEDLDAAGFPQRKRSLGREGVEACLRWLANFHATFMDEAPAGLWEVGTYWHLATRPDERAAMPDGALKDAAAAIDARLNGCRLKTVLHGDAKLENFCFSADAERVAAVDFQYAGGGCGMKDVAYFLGSCLGARRCEQWEGELLDCYFSELSAALHRSGKSVDMRALEAEWRELFPLAWADFDRFLLGWQPGHWKINGYSRRQVEKALALLAS